MVGFGFADFPCFCSFSSWLWGSLARKKGGEKLDWGLNAYKEMPAHLVFVKMCTSAQRRSETGCFTLLWQDTQQAKGPKQIKPHAHFNQGLYSLSQVKSRTNVLAWVAVNLSFCKEQALRFSKAVLLISIKGLEKQRLEEGRGSLILGRGPRKTRCLGGGSIDTLGIEKVSNASCRAPQRMRVSDAFVSLYGKMIARGFTRLGKAAASFPHNTDCRAGIGRAALCRGRKPQLAVQLSSARASVLFAHLLMDVTPCPRSRRWH